MCTFVSGLIWTHNNWEFVVVQLLSCVWLFVTPMECRTLGSPVLHHLPEFAQIHVHWVSDAITVSSSIVPSMFPSTRVFSNELALCIKFPKNWSFSISPSDEYSGLSSFRIDWFDLLAVQMTLKSLLWNHNSKASILQCSTFFMNQLSHPYMTTGKTIALTIQTFVGQVMSMLFNTFFFFTFNLEFRHL